MAVTVVSAVSVTTHGAVPVQPPPDQPENVELASAVAITVTIVPAGWASVQAVPQSMPAGLDVTVPVPLPASATVSVTSTGGASMGSPVVASGLEATEPQAASASAAARPRVRESEDA
ncbi:MAG: hypothetical protein IPL61_20125 [Myxococcales bacterium]|nr:hypothetical protein [Myxococcales bacterium]